MGKRKRTRILLVDDHKLMREGIRDLLRLEEDFEVVAEAGGVDEAVEAVQRWQPDLIMMDVHMPEGSGLDALQRIKAIAPQTSIIMLTMASDSETVLRASELGASGYLTKDTSRSELVEAIRAIERGTPVLDRRVGWKVLERFSRSRRGGASDEPEPLTQREQEVLRLLTEGRSNREIATTLFITHNTLKTHIRHIQQKLGTQDRVQTVAHALRSGLVK